jgi:predicted permease
MCKLFATLVTGFLLCKTGILDSQTREKLSQLIVTVTAPLLALSSVSSVTGNRDEVLHFFLMGVLFYLFFPMIGWLVTRLLRIPKGLRGTYTCMVVFSNTAFMGYPVVSALFGDAAIFYTMIFHMPFNLLFYSFGMRMIFRDISDGEEKAGLRKNPRQMLRQVMNNGMIAAVLALILYFSRLPLPVVVNETCHFIGDTTMPLSMLVIGGGIAGYSWKEIFADKNVYLITLIRLAVMPCLGYLVIRLFVDSELLVRIVTITMGMPIASLVAMATTPYPRQGKEAAISVVFTTLCSMVSIPVLSLLLGI